MLRVLESFLRTTPGRTPWLHPERHGDAAADAHNTHTMMLFAVHAANTGRRSATTVLQYCSLLRAHVALTHGITIPSTGRAWKRLAQALRRRHPGGRGSSLPLRAEHLRRAFSQPQCAADRAKAHLWAALSTGWQALARPSELLALKRSDLTWTEGAAVIQLLPLKKRPGHPPVPIIITPGDGSGSDAYAALANLEAVDPVPPHARRTTPLFRLERHHGRRASLMDLTTAVRLAVRTAGVTLPAARRFSGRSLRVGGATELAAAGADPLSIRLLGRWDSSTYRAYTRVSRGQAMRLSSLMGRARAADPALEALLYS